MAKNDHKWGKGGGWREINSNGSSKSPSATSLLLFKTQRLSWVFWLNVKQCQKALSRSSCRLLLFEIRPREWDNLLESHLPCHQLSCLGPPSLFWTREQKFFCRRSGTHTSLNTAPTPRPLWVNAPCSFSLWLFVSEVPTRIFLIRSEAMTSSCSGTCQSNTSVTWWWRTRRWSLAWSECRAPLPSGWRHCSHRHGGGGSVMAQSSYWIFTWPHKAGFKSPSLARGELKHGEVQSPAQGGPANSEEVCLWPVLCCTERIRLESLKVDPQNQHLLNFYVPYGPNLHKIRQNFIKWSLGYGDDIWGIFPKCCLFMFYNSSF